MRNSPFWLIIIGLMIVAGFLCFPGGETVSQGAASKTKIHHLYHLTGAISYWRCCSFLLLPYLNLENHSKGLRTTSLLLWSGCFLPNLRQEFFYWLMISDG